MINTHTTLYLSNFVRTLFSILTSITSEMPGIFYTERKSSVRKLRTPNFTYVKHMASSC